MDTKKVCTCTPVTVRDSRGEPVGMRLIYDTQCTKHTGPDEGYGYDSWGQPNSKHSRTIGTIGGVFIVGAIAGVFIFLILLAAGKFG